MQVAVILKEDVDTLGTAGDIKRVRPGYARNYLIPYGFAVLATVTNLQWLAGERENLAKQTDERKQECEAVKTSIQELGDLEIFAPLGPTGQLFGRITAKDICAKLSEVTKGQIVLNHKFVSIDGHPRGVNELGAFIVNVALGLNVSTKLKLLVAEGK